MEEIKHRRWLRIFKAVALLVLAQVGWWTMAFLKDVYLIEQLKLQTLAMTSANGADLAQARARILREAFHQRVMFLSESSFFVAMACLALYLLYQALQAEQKSREIQRNFIETVTHESKTPLTAMKLRLESVIEKYGSDPSLSRELGLALEEVRRLVSIFEKAMNLNRVERHAFRFETLAFQDIIKAVTHRLEPLFKAKNVELQLDVDPEAYVSGDAYFLQNSVQSLIENALFYNPADVKKIGISVKKDGHRVVLGVTDNGPGIAPEDRARIFERFYRGSGTSRVPGTGLGLYLVKTIMEAHNGEIRLVHSDSSGSRFEIEMPKAGAA